MVDAKDVFKRLSEPHAPEEVEWRVGSTNHDKTKGLALAYQTSRAVMNRLDDVVGPENWRDEYERWGERAVLCKLSIRVGDEWITKQDAASESDIESTKGGISDAFKRAAVKFGIGRYLYYLDSPWVDLEHGKYIAKHEQPRLRALLEGREANHGAAPTPSAGQPSPSAARPRPSPEPPQEDDAANWEPKCPKCGGLMWDNRTTKRNPKAPDFKCKNKDCGGVIWPPKKGKSEPAIAPVTADEADALGLNDVPF